MSTLNALTENSTPNAKGVITDEVVTLYKGQSYKQKGYTFCLKEINISKKEKDKYNFILEGNSTAEWTKEMNDDGTLVIPKDVLVKITNYLINSDGQGKYSFTELNPIIRYTESPTNTSQEQCHTLAIKAELYSVMSNLSGGCGLCVMPLFKFESTNEKYEYYVNEIKNNAINIGLPINLTVWVYDTFDREVTDKRRKELFEKPLISSGYSVGYINTNHCERNTNKDNDINAPYTVVTEGSLNDSDDRTITLNGCGIDNKIRWAFLPSK